VKKKRMEENRRPNRSDTHLSAEEEAIIEAKTRHHFDEVAPKRHTKPQRSDYASQYVDNNVSDNTVPEMLQFQRLENDPREKVSSQFSTFSSKIVSTDTCRRVSVRIVFRAS
jgi:hypothetical protein